MAITPTVSSTVTSATVNPLLAAAATPKAAATALASAQEQSDRFLKLLVTQMQNQDPLNPMDNAQITTQMAQISTVSGIDKLAATMASVNSSMLQMQSLEAATLVGKSVLVEGHRLLLDDKGNTTAGFDLAGPASSVVATIKSADGKVIDSIDLGALPAGRQTYTWKAATAGVQGMSFEISATQKGEAVAATRLISDRVDSVFMDKGGLTLELVNAGSVAYSQVKGVAQ